VSALTWSQRGIWDLQREIWPEHQYFNLSRQFEAPTGCALTDVEDALRWIVERYEAFRTTVRRDPGGVPYQHVAATGAYPLDVHEADGTDPASLAERLAGEYRGQAFADDEWPLRVAAVTQGGGPAYLLFTASHLAVDGWGLQVAQLAFVGRLTGQAASAEVPCQPVDRAAAEASAAGRRMAEKAVTYWRRSLRAIPQTMFPWEPAQPRGRWCPTGELTSAAAALAADALAARHAATPSSVILAATAALLGVRTENETVAMCLLAANRDEAKIREMVGSCIQPVLFTVDLGGGASFHDLIDRTWRSAVAARQNARYPPPLIDEAVQEINACRGIMADLLCHFYEGTEFCEETGVADRVVGAPRTAGQIAATRSGSRFRPGVLFGAPQKFLLHVSGHPGAELRLTLTADRGYLSREDVRALVCGIETVLIDAVGCDFSLAEAALRAGVAPISRGPAAVRVDRCWVELEAVSALLAAVPGVVAARAEVVESQRGGRLVGTVAVRDAGLDAARLHREVIRLLGDRPTAMAPQHYLIHLATDQAPVDIDALPRCGEGPGRPVYVPRPGEDEVN
jgi:hypothetical protein